MNIEQLNTELQALGDVVFCNYNGNNTSIFIIVLYEFQNTISNANSLQNIVNNYCSVDFPIINTYSISSDVVKIELSK